MAEGNRVFKIEIITPDRVFYTGEADFLEFTTTDGEIGVYKDHIPLTTVLAPGIVTIHNGDDIKTAAVHAGFAEILGDRVSLLAEVAEWPDEIDVERAEAAKARAEERLQNHTADVDMKRAEFALRKALIRIDTANIR
ncbi:MAG: ATP synthase F1 subunit epsilon [Lachnospiraceae bacterium]|nr:ATP synthase F1 subunit epsilon [Lachnospiraceae bacterium]MDD6504633.1 ATP synthase F1 subunit epsilon [Lachnospiraceae bacterium]